ncbi:BnaA03g57370D [Brassica napus]|uniref:BnaA03g57370D protein n=1 Tax=Brassica napus TaxID=3708 RepID=A0A078J3F0_BRANA|nr:BnaA03g57370D [Brassica napus]
MRIILMKYVLFMFQVGIYGYAVYSASKFGLKVWHSHCNKKLLLMIFMPLLFFLLTPIHLVLKKNRRAGLRSCLSGLCKFVSYRKILCLNPRDTSIHHVMIRTVLDHSLQARSWSYLSV